MLSSLASSGALNKQNIKAISKTDPVPSISQSLKSVLYTAITRPFHMLFTEPVVAAFAAWSAFSFGIVYACIQSITQIYEAHYGFTDAQSGYVFLCFNLQTTQCCTLLTLTSLIESLLQISVLIGLFLGILPCIAQNAYYQRSTLRNNNISIPERRLPASVIISLVGQTGGLFWYGWASYPHVHWIVPTLALALIGISVQIIITTGTLYIADAYSLFAGSAISVIGFGENMMAAWLPLATRRMYNALGYQWASSLLGFASLALTIAPLMLMIWGEKVREKSHFIKEARYSS